MQSSNAASNFWTIARDDYNPFCVGTRLVDSMDDIRGRISAWLSRARRIERRELREFRAWLEQTSTLVHLSVLVFVPFLIAFVTFLSTRLDELSFLLFPPLAAGSYTLFANPEGKYSSPVRFVFGLTIGALCGWAALELGAAFLYQTPASALAVRPGDAAISVFLTGAVTWALDIEEPAAYSTALLGLLVPPDQQIAFTLSVFAASLIVAVVFYTWREQVYDQRAQFLYESTHGDDHVLVPMRGRNPDATAMLGARIAAAHDAGKVVLLDIVDDEYAARAERELLDDHRLAGKATTNGVTDTDGGTDTDGEGEAPERALDEIAAQRAVSETAAHLEQQAADIETQVGVPCEVVVAVDGGSDASTVLKTADEVNCDLIAAAYEERHGMLSPYVRQLFRGDTDVIVHRSHAGRTRWKRVLVPVRRASDVAHNMLDFATRLADQTGRVSVGTCVTSDRERRRAEDMLANLVETLDGNVETRVSNAPIETFLAENAVQYDLTILGASTDRSAASRFVSPPTFERIQDIDCDVAIVDRN
jgi:nucleotide-binding universal stress UspA family protein/uncharacterized membrane protein (DUF485 family)